MPSKKRKLSENKNSSRLPVCWNTSFNSGALEDPLITAVLNSKLLADPEKIEHK